MKHDMKAMLNAATPKEDETPKVNKDLTHELIQLTLGDIFGKVYYDQPVGIKERLIIKSMISQVAKENRITDHQVRRDLRRYLNVSSVLRLNLGQYEKAVDYLVSRGR